MNLWIAAAVVTYLGVLGLGWTLLLTAGRAEQRAGQHFTSASRTMPHPESQDEPSSNDRKAG